MPEHLIKARIRLGTHWLQKLVAKLYAKAKQDLELIFDQDQKHMQSAE